MHCDAPQGTIGSTSDWPCGPAAAAVPDTSPMKSATEVVKVADARRTVIENTTLLPLRDIALQDQYESEIVFTVSSVVERESGQEST